MLYLSYRKAFINAPLLYQCISETARDVFLIIFDVCHPVCVFVAVPFVFVSLAGRVDNESLFSLVGYFSNMHHHSCPTCYVCSCEHLYAFGCVKNMTVSRCERGRRPSSASRHRPPPVPSSSPAFTPPTLLSLYFHPSHHYGHYVITTHCFSVRCCPQRQSCSEDSTWIQCRVQFHVLIFCSVFRKDVRLARKTCVSDQQATAN